MANRKQDDAALLRACERGDSSAWETLIERYGRLIYSVPAGYRLGADAAEEIFQRVAIRLFENVGKIRDPERLASWIVITTRRECWAYSREGARWKSFEEGEAESMPEDPPDVAADLEMIEAEHALALALERMDDSCRELLAALYLEEPKPSYQELSERLGRPIGSLGPTRARCLKKLQRLYLREGGPRPFSEE